MLYKSTLEARDGTAIPVFADGRTMFSRYAPLREAENFANGPSQDDGSSQGKGAGGGRRDGFFVVCGLGNGIHVMALKRRFPGSSILVIERSPEDIQWLAENFDLSELLSRQDIWITTLSQAAGRLARLYNPLLQGGFFLMPLRSWVDQLPQEAAAVKDEIRRALEDIAADCSTQAHFGKVWFRNFFLNLSLLPHVRSPAPLPDARDYSRAFVAAAGPGLEESIPELTQPRRRREVYLIAADTALPPLLRHGVEPDMVVTIDGQASSARHFLKEIPGTLVLAADISCCPPVVRRCHEAGCPVLFFRNRNPLPALFDRYLLERQEQGAAGLPVIDTGAGTVAAAAVDLARWLGFSRIQVGGADFAYVGGKPYCRGTYFEDQFVQSACRTAPMEQGYVELMFRGGTGRDGNRITTPVLDSYRKSLQDYMQRHGDIQFILREGQPAGGPATSGSVAPVDSAPPAGLQGGRSLPPRIPEGLAAGFVEWFKGLLLQRREEAISSILPLYGWHLKKNNDKCDVFHIMKLAYSQAVRYTIHYGK